MKILLVLLTLGLSAFAAERIAPALQKANTEEVRLALASDEGEFDLTMIRRGLVSDQTYDRARCAQFLAKNGTAEDIPYLIDALSDDSVHVGANYPVAGMATTRFWANVALIAICKTSYDFQWDGTDEDREYAVSLWKQHWERNKPKNE